MEMVRPYVVTLTDEDMAVIRIGLLHMTDPTDTLPAAWYSPERSERAAALRERLNLAAAGMVLITHDSDVEE